MRPSVLRKILKERYTLNQTLTNLHRSTDTAADPAYNKELQVWKNRGGTKMRDYEKHAIYHTNRKQKGLLTAR